MVHRGRDGVRVAVFVLAALAAASVPARACMARRTARAGGVAFRRACGGVRKVLKVAPWALPRRVRAVARVRAERAHGGRERCFGSGFVVIPHGRDLFPGPGCVLRASVGVQVRGGREGEG